MNDAYIKWYECITRKNIFSLTVYYKLHTIYKKYFINTHTTSIHTGSVIYCAVEYTLSIHTNI